MQKANLDLTYKLGVQHAVDFVKTAKLFDKDNLITAATAYVSPTLSGLTAESGKGLQTSAAGLGANFLTKLIFKNPHLARAAGALGATVGSKLGTGLVSPDPKVIEGMRRRGEFSKWNFLRNAGRGAVYGAGIGGTLALGGGLWGLAMAPSAMPLAAVASVTGKMVSPGAISFVAPALASAVPGLSTAATAAGAAGTAGALGAAAPTLGGITASMAGAAATGGARGFTNSLLVTPLLTPVIRKAASKIHEWKNRLETNR